MTKLEQMRLNVWFKGLGFKVYPSLISVSRFLDYHI
jgi:hypothetical protein